MKRFIQGLEWSMIFIAHIALLKWILYVLKNTGHMTMDVVFYHFLGMSIAGGLLIRTCAYLAKRRYLQDGGKILKPNE